MSPYANEHACRLLDPALFKTCRRTVRKSDGKEYSVLTCQYKKRPEGKSDWAEQAYRYDRKVWTVQQAKNHCDLKEGLFEPAEVELNELLKEFKFGFLIPRDIKLSKKHTIDIEILREGKWTHPEAPDGTLEIEKSDLDTFQKNFEDAVVGDRLPVDLEHKPEKGHAIGWILKLWQTLKKGSWHLWAKIDVTDEQAQENLKNGSLRYISPQLLVNWQNPEDNKLYDVIRSAALTNYPFIKGMQAAIVNFSEIEGGEQIMLTEKELKELEGTLKTKETELKDKEGKLDTREEAITTKEEDVDTKEEDVKERQVAIDNALKQMETHNSFHGLPKAQALELANKAKTGDQKASDLIIKFASGGVYEYSKAELIEELKGVGIEVEDLPQFESKKADPKLEARVAELEKDKEVKGTALKAALDQLQSVNAEFETAKVETKLNELGITPANRELLKGILLAKKGSKIKLTEKEGEKEVKKEYTVAEAVIKLISGDQPFRVEPGQQSILSPKSPASVTMREGLQKVLDMSDKEWEDLPEKQRNFFLKKLGGGE